MFKQKLLIAAVCVALLLSFALACCCPVGLPTGGNNTTSGVTSIPANK